MLIVGEESELPAAVNECLSRAGFHVTSACSFAAAKRLLETHRSDVLITAVRLAAFNGLQLALLHSAGGRGASIVVDCAYDAQTEAEARRLGAAYMHQPVALDRLVEAVRSGRAVRADAAPSIATRRWQRTRLSLPVPAAIDGLRAELVEVAYGGVQVALPGSNAQIPPQFTLRARGLPAPVLATRVWERRSSQMAITFCGASVQPIDPGVEALWRQSVDAWAVGGGQPSL
ncbi:MAG: response regulator [Acidobacteria bacterium]|nr:response regulator [Acidobacteriota bacterium]